MYGLGSAIAVLDIITAEALLFAAVFFIILGIDDLAVDVLWGWRGLRRRLTVYRRHRRHTLADFPAPRRRFAVLVPAWEEAPVIEPMLRTMLARLAGDITVFVGCYPNDRETVAAVARVARDDDRIVVVINPSPGPTTKADNLNVIWRGVRSEERRDGRAFDAVVLHDAEDLVHSGELAVFDRLLDRASVVQLPVLPLIDDGSRWIAGHYADEFADGHGRQLVLREALGAALPLAGTGFAIDRDALAYLAALSGGSPFDADSLTEDYELGMALAGIGAEAIFARVPVAKGAGPVAVRAHFPSTLRTTVAQKSRWMAGIAFAGWDRIGWGRTRCEKWMRMRDRRAPVAMIVIFAGYMAMAAWAMAACLRFIALEPLVLPDVPTPLLAMTGALAVWRLGMRAAIVGSIYGRAEGARSVPRTLVANLVTLLAGWRALFRYLSMLGGHRPAWGKTAHVFPAQVPAE